MDVLSDFFKDMLNAKYNYKVSVVEYFEGIELTITLPKGQEFCCGEPICHFFMTEEKFQELRKLLKYDWLNKLYLKFVVEDGAILYQKPCKGYVVEETIKASR